MRRIQLVVLLVASLGLGGCADTIPLAGGKSILSIPSSRASEFLAKLGYPGNPSAFVRRSSSGDRLFVQFEDGAGGSKVAVVSPSGITLRDLPGQSCLNDEGLPVFWLNKSRTAFQFAGGYSAPTNVYCNWASDGKFVGIWRAHGDHWWIARVEAPLEEIVTFDWDHELELLISHGDRLHVFVRGEPEGKPRRDRWFILKRYEYQIDCSKARLVQVQDFYYTWSVMDFDPENNLMFASSWDTMFAHGLLVNTITGERREVRCGHGRGYFLEHGVIKQFRSAARGSGLGR